MIVKVAVEFADLEVLRLWQWQRQSRKGRVPEKRQYISLCNNPMEIDLVILVAKGEALHDQSSVQEIDDLSKQKRHVKSGEVLRHAGSTNFV
ncbi:hypothetical protein J6590_021010 [Homalodisca vitripennis]|nr:hypothetical protein J6590_021010 [Homalodisca vitripennis]